MSESSADLMRGILRSPTLFAWHFLKLKLFPYQADVLENTTKRTIVVSGRQIGKTQMLALYALWWGLVKPKQTILLIAPTMRQSKLIYDRLVEMGERSEFVITHLENSTLSQTRFDNGSTIYCLPAGRSGEYIRGFSANLVLLDEGSLVPDGVWRAIRPTVSAVDGTIILSGTPFGEEGFYYRVWMNDPSKEAGQYGWKKVEVKSAESPLITKEFLDEERRTMSEAEFAMEYEAKFVSETDEYFSRVVVRKIVRDYEYKIVENADVVIGVDVARFGTDETAVVVLRRLVGKRMEECKRKERLYRVEWRDTKGITTIPEVAVWVRELIDEWSPKSVVVDSTGLGSGVVDMLELDVDDIIEGLVLRGERRRMMYESLKMAMERENLRLNQNDEKMLRQFGGYRLKKTSNLSGELRVTKSTTARDDLVDALALALWGYEEGGGIGPMDPGLVEEVINPTIDGSGSALALKLRNIRREHELEDEWLDEYKSGKSKIKQDADFWGV